MEPNYSSLTRQALLIAQEESRARRHDYVGTEHLLLAFIRAGGRTDAILTQLGLTSERIRENVHSLLRPGKFEPPLYTLPWTTRAKKVSELARQEAESRNSVVIEPEHFLVALFLEEKGIASEALSMEGVTLDMLRLAAYGHPEPPAEATLGTDDSPRMVVSAEIPVWVHPDTAAEILSETVQLLSKLNIVFGGAGLVLDDVEIDVKAYA